MPLQIGGLGNMLVTEAWKRAVFVSEWTSAEGKWTIANAKLDRLRQMTSFLSIYRVFIEQTRNKRTCNRVKSSGHSNSTKVK